MRLMHLWKQQSGIVEAGLSLLALAVVLIVAVLAYMLGGSLLQWWSGGSCKHTPPYLRFQLGEVQFRIPSHYRLGWKRLEKDGGYISANTELVGRKRKLRKVCQADSDPPLQVKRLSIYGPLHLPPPPNDPIRKIGNSDVHLATTQPGGRVHCPTDSLNASSACPWRSNISLSWSGVWQPETKTRVPALKRDADIRSFIDRLVIGP